MIRVKSYAKINLHLAVLSKRQDGYHNLQTIFARISLYDEVFLEAKREPVVELLVRGDKGVPQGSRNLAFKAARWYLNRYKIEWGVRILIDKKIPPKSGLGGGSSNAAAVIRGLGQFFKEWDPEIVRDSVVLGADVPFFISDIPFAYAEGIGEIIEPIENLSFREKVALICPDFGVSAKEAFELYDKFGSGHGKIMEKNHLIETLLSEDWKKMKDVFFNDLEAPLFKKYPDLLLNKDLLINEGSLFSLVSGSGSSVFGIFEDKKDFVCPKGELIWCEFI